MVGYRAGSLCRPVVIALVVAVCLLAGGAAYATVIDFDSLAPGTMLNGVTLQGVTFSSATGGTVQVQADNYYGGGWASAHNWIMANTTSIAMDSVDMAFTLPVTSLSVTGGDDGGDTDSFLLQVYDNYGSLLGSASTGIFGGNLSQGLGYMTDMAALSLSGLGPIYSARVQATSPSNAGVCFDDIEFEAVPEPGTLALMAAGATGVLASFRRRRRR